ncbi:PIG-L deacetylase family protein [Endozoicomonas sp. SCSIO W0465]|uniref:PIG-L deacetylase family protein n=1 Tax=Endozoicomonas sp. SCSIO W0465 TaxID=2918516 RepID=UPI002075291C|nr:PIG-L deacetylase family protein [Endozoicomonas sp. SCSIO W0465]USE39414.1 PIG-L family deacetylase [Endozoicomonas sp. SCSIO W0465]
MNKILVVAAHADDETLGCGGTIARHIAEGDHVKILFMTDGVSSRGTQQAACEIRNSAAIKALSALGTKDYQQLDFPDNKMDSLPLLEIVKPIESVISTYQPNIVYTHFADDLNIDHRIVNQAVMTACRPQNGNSIRKIFSFEVLSSTEWNSTQRPVFNPQYIVDISDYWGKKVNALNAYKEELRVFPHSRSLECIEALAILRGATHGITKAEAFVIERYLV